MSGRGLLALCCVVYFVQEELVIGDVPVISMLYGLYLIMCDTFQLGLPLLIIY